jgi:hypothetical protein
MPPKGSRKKGATAPSQSMDDPQPKRTRKKTARAAQMKASSHEKADVITEGEWWLAVIQHVW